MEYKKKEIWRDIPNYEGLYQASNSGKIRSLDHKIITNGNVKKIHGRFSKGKVLSQGVQNGGYCVVSLSVNGKRKVCTVHRLVAKTFINKPNDFREVNHKDGDKKNNNLENLEWITHGNNIKHSYRKLDQKRHYKPIKCIETGLVYSSCVEAEEKTGINKSSINHAVNGLYRQAGGFKWKRA